MYENTVSGVNGSTFNKNFQQVGSDESSEYRKRAYFLITSSDLSNWSNYPGDFSGVPTIVGLREVFSPTSAFVMVKLTMIWPTPGKQYYRSYNSGTGEWSGSGWYEIEPQ